MKVLKYDLFDAVGKVDIICITTNGYINKKQECVMGCGCAKEASDRYPGIAKRLADNINANGNVPCVLGESRNTLICSFPVKPISSVFDGANAVSHMKRRYNIGDTVPGWACKADLRIIKDSAIDIVKIANKMKANKIAIPMPGCGAGELGWNEVGPVLDVVLDDRFYILYKI